MCVKYWLVCVIDHFLVLESGVGAGIDSYYEYCLKSYVLLGDEEYLRRFRAVSDDDPLSH